jgi:hypothetical protein
VASFQPHPWPYWVNGTPARIVDRVRCHALLTGILRRLFKVFEEN